ncbi:MAG: hypothetical protein SOT68_00690 [Oscillospiraceae bacterium]|nr:hypothetical protein [Oscillospiraceae bacterium]
MKEYDEDSYKLVQNYIKSKTRLLPIVISGSSSSLSQSFLNALQQALSGNDLNDIMPDTHFKAAKQTIEKWLESYPETYTQFENKISVNVSSFIAELDDHNTEAYKEFISIYPELTAGSVFNPFLADDVAKLYYREWLRRYIMYDNDGVGNIKTTDDIIISSELWESLSRSDVENIKDICNNALDKYFKRLEGEYDE